MYIFFFHYQWWYDSIIFQFFSLQSFEKKVQETKQHKDLWEIEVKNFILEQIMLKLAFNKYWNKKLALSPVTSWLNSP